MEFLILLKIKTIHSLIVNVPGNLNFPQKQTISSQFFTITFLHKMAEAMFEVVLPKERKLKIGFPTIPLIYILKDFNAARNLSS